MPGLLILRHSESTWNAMGLWQGQADPPLSNRGELEASAAGKCLQSRGRVDLMVTSDLERALRTAHLMLGELTPRPAIEVDTALREFDAGQWSGLTRDEIEARWPGALESFSSRDLDAPPGGEDRVTFDERVLTAIRRVDSEARQNGLESVVVIAHGGVIRSLATQAGSPDVRVGQLAGYHFWWEDGCLRLGDFVDLVNGKKMPDEVSL